MSIHHRIAVVKRGWQIFRPSHVRTGADGCESQATGKSRRTPSPAAQRSHHRLAGHAEPGRLGGLHRQDKVEEVHPGRSRGSGDVQRSLLVRITRATTINDFAWL